MIPYIIHHMWYDQNNPNADIGNLPKHNDIYLEYSKKLKKLNPSFEYKFWNKKKVDELWTSSELLKPYKNFFFSLEKTIEKCDYSRYAILYVYGGIYVDLDMIAVRSFDTLLEGKDFGWAFEPPEHRIGNRKTLISNQVIFCIKDHYLWPKLLQYIIDHYKPQSTVLLNTGPVRLGIFYDNHPTLLSKECFIDYCLLNPMISNQTISSTCNNDVLKEKAYTYTKWNEGSNWFVQEIFTKENAKNMGFVILCVLLYFSLRYSIIQIIKIK